MAADEPDVHAAADPASDTNGIVGGESGRAGLAAAEVPVAPVAAADDGGAADDIAAAYYAAAANDGASAVSGFADITGAVTTAAADDGGAAGSGFAHIAGAVTVVVTTPVAEGVEASAPAG